MSSWGARPSLWLRYGSAVAVLVWAVGLGAGCHVLHSVSTVVHAAGTAREVSSVSHQMGGVNATHASSVHACSPIVGGCDLILRASPTRGPAGLVLALAIAVFAGVVAGSAIPVTRGPPRSVGVIEGQSGRIILIRFCTARI